MTYSLSSNFHLPDRLPTMKQAIIGRTGSGKTNTAVVMAEQMIAGGIPVAIIDPQGDWWGLRSKYPIAILGGEHADVPLEPTGGTIAADFVVNERIPVLLDLFTMGEGEMVRFATDFARRLWQINREALHIFLDEADLFAPQKGGSDKTRCLSAWQNVCRRGRSRGLGMTLLTQRTAVINKDLLTQADPLYVHRLTAPQDLAAVDAYLEYHGGDLKSRRRILADISKMPVGECWVISPGELEIEPTRVKVRSRKSFDSSATPEPGETRREPKSLADVDLGALTKSMADTIERAKSSDPAELRKQIAEMEKRIKQLERPSKSPVSVTDPAVIEQAVTKAVADRDQHWKREVADLLKAISGRDDRLAKIEKLAHLNGDSRVIVEAPQVPVVAAKPSSPVDQQVTEGLSKKQQEILDAIAWWESIGVTSPTNAQVGAVARIDASGGHFSNVSGPLSRNGLIERGGGTIRLTEDGRRAARPIDETITIDAYHDVIRQRIRNTKRANGRTVDILDAVIAFGGEDITNEQIGEAVGIDTSGGHFSNCIGPLSSLGFIDRRGGVVHPTELLFPPGL